jgi:hypothetical protein
MGFVWAVRRSLRLLTLLTLMASALCTGQTLAAQESAAPPRITPADSVTVQSTPVLATFEVFERAPTAAIASAIRTVEAAFRPVFSFTAPLAFAPVAAAPLLHHFSPPAERAPPAA